ncbi:MAG: GNAT family N-acetyltransferase [Acholeplasmataceae bacterium]
MKFRYESNRIYVLDDEGKQIVNGTFPWEKEGVANVNHTFVDPSLRGQGIASKLMHEIYNYAKENSFKLVATCPYAVVWFKKNPDKMDIIDAKTQATLNPECLI